MVEVLGKPVPEELLDHLSFMHDHNAEDVFRAFSSDEGDGTVMVRSYKNGFFVTGFAVKTADGSWECRSHWVSMPGIADLVTAVPEAYQYLEPLFKRRND